MTSTTHPLSCSTSTETNQTSQQHSLLFQILATSGDLLASLQAAIILLNSLVRSSSFKWLKKQEKTLFYSNSIG